MSYPVLDDLRAKTPDIIPPAILAPLEGLANALRRDFAAQGLHGSHVEAALAGYAIAIGQFVSMEAAGEDHPFVRVTAQAGVTPPVLLSMVIGTTLNVEGLTDG